MDFLAPNPYSRVLHYESFCCLPCIQLLPIVSTNNSTCVVGRHIVWCLLLSFWIFCNFESVFCISPSNFCIFCTVGCMLPCFLPSFLPFCALPASRRRCNNKILRIWSHKPTSTFKLSEIQTPPLLNFQKYKLTHFQTFRKQKPH